MNNISKKQKIKDCIDDKMSEFEPIGDTQQDRVQSIRNAFTKAAEDCKKKYGE